ncbi:MAG TPA: hypothetical protein VHG51_18565 [Longimicrobiaceae bacterium]|nr:hypothetical protein [Longimicrobiaceae bacterium]
MRRPVVLLAGILLGCSDPIDTAALDFRAEPLGAEEVNEWSVARLESGDHRVTVRRAADAARRCEDLEAELLHAAGSLTLRVSDSARGGGEGGAQPCGYTAVLDRIPSGQYTLRVVHSDRAGRSGAHVVLNQTLHIR